MADRARLGQVDELNKIAPMNCIGRKAIRNDAWDALATLQ